MYCKKCHEQRITRTILRIKKKQSKAKIWNYSIILEDYEIILQTKAKTDSNFATCPQFVSLIRCMHGVMKYRYLAAR